MSKDLGLLVLRLGFGGVMLFAHGFGKVEKLVSSEPASPFFNILGLSAGFALFLVAIAETVGALGIIVGFYTRICSIVLAFTMFVAAFIAHGPHPFQKKELAIMYMIGYIAIALLGTGNILNLSSYLKKFKSSNSNSS